MERVILIAHCLQKLSISLWIRYLISPKIYEGDSDCGEAGLNQHCFTGGFCTCRLDSACSQYSGKNTIIAQRMDTSGLAEKKLISVPSFLQSKPRASQIVSAAFQLFSVSLWAHIKDVCHISYLHKHNSYVQASAALHQQHSSVWSAGTSSSPQTLQLFQRDDCCCLLSPRSCQLQHTKDTLNVSLALLRAARKGNHFPGAPREESVPRAGCRRRWRALGSARRVLQAGSMGPSHREALRVQESTEGQCTEYKMYYTL